VARRARALTGDLGGDPAQALRRHLIEVTQRLLAAHGLTTMTTRRIAREAQVADGVLYNHFADKDALVVTALAEQITTLVQRFLDGCPAPGAQDLRDGLTQLARLSRRFQSDALPLVAALLSRPDLVHQLLAQLHANDPGPQLLWGRIAEYVRGEQQRGSISSAVDPLTVAHVLFGVEHLGALFAALAGGDNDPAHGGADPSTARRRPDDPSLPDEGHLVDFVLRACAPD
jgi:AcrR family transcriptional regulator